MADPNPWHLRLRRLTAQQWMLMNPILSMDEVGVEKDTRKFKIGNGVTPWSLLTYGQVSDGKGLVMFPSKDAGNKIVRGSDDGLYVGESTGGINFAARYTLGKS